MQKPQSSSEQEVQQDESKEVRPIEQMEPKHRAQQEWPLFSPLDTNGDGFISKEEAKKLEALDFHFRQVDRNKDDKIDRTEFGAFKAMQIRSFYKGGDSREQVGGAAHGVPPENPHDKNNSTPDEMKQQQSQEGTPVKEPELGQKREIEQIEQIEKNQPILESQQQNEGTTNQANQPSQKDKSANMESSKKMKKEQPSFSQLDADQDGYISKEEAKAFDELAFHFKQLDQNKDGKLDSSEFGAFKAMQMRGFDHGGDSGEHGARPSKQDKGAESGAESQP
jgi:Ca2+-binding EF-hand superfamily protein